MCHLFVNVLSFSQPLYWDISQDIFNDLDLYGINQQLAKFEVIDVS